MKLYNKNVTVLLSTLIILCGCSFNDLTNMWPSENENEIVIREIPTESFDPEDTEEIIITNENTEQQNEEITIVDTNETTETELGSIDELFDEGDSSSLDTEISSNTDEIPTTNYRGNPVFTYVGQRIIEMKEEFNKLDQDITLKKNNFDQLRSTGIQSAENYHSIVAAIAARLQIGTTPGNPILLDQYEKAQTELADVGAQGQTIVDVGNQIALLSTRVSYLLEQARSAKKLRGAVDEDHRNLSSFQDNLKMKSVDLVRVLEELNETVRRRDIFLAAERRRLTQLANAIAIGETFGLGLGTIKSLPVLENSEKQQRSESNVSATPIAIFRVNELEKYQQSLFGAVSAALDKAPEATFTLVAVSSTAGNASEQAERAANVQNNVSKVMSSLISMGMPADRLSVSTLAVASIENTEIRVYAD